MDRFYEDPNSLFVTAYDAFYAGEPPQIAGDVAFYEHLARETGGPMLELGCVVLDGSRWRWPKEDSISLASMSLTGC